MNFFNLKPNKDLTELLKKSKQDFRFDQEQVRDKLLYDLGDATVKPPQRIFFSIRFVKYSLSAALPLVFISAAFTFASNARPGDRFFALNKFGEKVILSLPLSMEQEANVYANIVSRRLEALEEMEEPKPLETVLPEPEQPKAKLPEPKTLETTPDPEQPKDKHEEAKQLESRRQTKQLETIRESEESIKDAIDTVSKYKRRLESSGKTASSEKLGKILNQIDGLAEKHEEKIKSLEASFPDKKIKESIDQRLLEIKNSRRKARQELNLKEENTDDPAEQKPQEKTDEIPAD